MMKTWKFLIYLIPATLLLTSCSGKATEEAAGQEVQKAGKNTEAASKEDDAAEKETEEPEPEILHFVDVYQNPYQVEINPNVEKHDYKDDSFAHNGDRLSYEDDSNYTYRLGVDVSEHQGYVDWQTLKTADLSLPLSGLATGATVRKEESAWTGNFTGISRTRRPPVLM